MTTKTSIIKTTTAAMAENYNALQLDKHVISVKNGGSVCDVNKFLIETI